MYVPIVVCIVSFVFQMAVFSRSSSPLFRDISQFLFHYHTGETLCETPLATPPESEPENTADVSVVDAVDNETPVESVVGHGRGRAMDGQGGSGARVQVLSKWHARIPCRIFSICTLCVL